MNTTTSSFPRAGAGAATAASSATRAARRLVVDAPTRMFHALFALSFAGAYLTAEGERWRALHVTLGYVFAGLLMARVLYGLFGPRQAGLGALWRKLQGAPAWVRSMRQAGSGATLPWRQGQNLAMALAIVALLLMAVPLALSGLGTYLEWGTPFGADVFEEPHEFFGNAFAAVVLMHLGLIAGLSVLRRRNQALPMLTGRIEGPGPDLVRRERRGLAIVLLLAVLGFGAWQWQQSPGGLLSGAASASQVDKHRHHDADD